jgi:hypothetical protein
MHAYVRDVMTTEVIAARPDASYRWSITGDGCWAS